jgi:hypothetical protein
MAMVDELPHGIAPRSGVGTASKQLSEPEAADETRGDGACGFVLDLVEMLPGAQDVVGVVERLVGRILFRHEAQIVSDMGEVMPCDPVEHVEDLRLLAGVFHRDGHAVTVVEDHVVIEGVVVEHAIVVGERQYGELGMKFRHVGARLDNRRDTMFQLAFVEHHGAVEDGKTARGLGLTKRRTTRGVSLCRLVPVKRNVAALTGVSAAAVFYSPLPRYGRASP